MTAGLVLRISPPIDGSNATHHTSPRRGVLSGFIHPEIIGDVAGEIFGPLGGFALTLLVGRHRAIAFRQIACGDVRTREIVQKPADTSPPDDAVQPRIDIILDRDRQFFGHDSPLQYVLYTYQDVACPLPQVA